MVMAFTRWRSPDNRQGNLFPVPITPFSEAATMMDRIIVTTGSNGYRRFDVRMRIVVFDHQVFKTEREDIFHLGVEPERR